MLLGNARPLELINLAANLQQLANDYSDSKNNDILQAMQKQSEEILKEIRLQNAECLEVIQKRLERIENALRNNNGKD